MNVINIRLTCSQSYDPYTHKISQDGAQSAWEDVAITFQNAEQGKGEEQMQLAESEGHSMASVVQR
jgi:hypothetical protein